MSSPRPDEPGQPAGLTAQPAYYTVRDERLVCTLCPHGCVLADGESGICGVRTNRSGILTLPFYARASALNIDPIEKKPLYHFHPGSGIVSIGFLGCNFRCPFCQNYSISQQTAHPTEHVPPERLVRIANDSRSAAGADRQPPVVGIAYTYNEPSIHFEYVTEAARLARDAGLKNVLVTNGHLNPSPAREVLALIDAVNVDLKSISDEFYRHEIGGSLKAVMKFIEIASETTHAEVTTLLLPGRNDSDGSIDTIARFVASLDPEIPLHLSAYRPAYRYSDPATSDETLLHAVEVARAHLRYVYPGNIASEASTPCTACGALLVRRRGYHVDRSGLQAGHCTSCGAASPIVDA